MFRTFLSVLMLLAVSVTILAAEDDAAQRALLASVRDTGSLTAKGGKPVHLKISFHAYGTRSGDLDGKYELYWRSEEQLRQNMQLGSYEETRIRVNSSTWRQSNLAFAPLAITFVEGMFRTLQNPVGNPKKFGKIREETVRGLRAECFDAKDGHYTYKLCVGPDHSILRVEYRSEFDRGVHEFWDYAQFGSKIYPRQMSYERNGKKLLEAKIDSIEEWTPVDNELKPLPGSELTRTCDIGMPSPPKATYTPDPLYPVEMGKHRNALVVLRVRLSPEGKLTAMEVQQTAGAAFDREAIAAVKQWKFNPAKCAGVPVEVEVNIEVNFNM